MQNSKITKGSVDIATRIASQYSWPRCKFAAKAAAFLVKTKFLFHKRIKLLLKQMSTHLQALTVKALHLRYRVKVLANKAESGEWRTINGRYVLVGKGETPLEALNKSLGKGVVTGVSQEWATANTPSEKDLSKLEGLSKTVLSDLGIKKEAVPFGQCAVTCTTMWDRLGQPKSVVPTSVMVGEDEHVILFNRKEGWALDPTGRQYDYPFFTRWANDSTMACINLSTN